MIPRPAHIQGKLSQGIQPSIPVGKGCIRVADAGLFAHGFSSEFVLDRICECISLPESGVRKGQSKVSTAQNCGLEVHGPFVAGTAIFDGMFHNKDPTGRFRGFQQESLEFFLMLMTPDSDQGAPLLGCFLLGFTYYLLMKTSAYEPLTLTGRAFWGNNQLLSGDTSGRYPDSCWVYDARYGLSRTQIRAHGPSVLLTRFPL